MCEDFLIYVRKFGVEDQETGEDLPFGKSARLMPVELDPGDLTTRKPNDREGVEGVIALSYSDIRWPGVAALVRPSGRPSLPLSRRNLSSSCVALTASESEASPTVVDRGDALRGSDLEPPLRALEREQ